MGETYFKSGHLYYKIVDNGEAVLQITPTSLAKIKNEAVVATIIRDIDSCSKEEYDKQFIETMIFLDII